MEILNKTIKDYIEILSTKSPTPGGGSVSAFSGAQGMALVSMVCDLTIGKEEYKEVQELAISTKNKCNEMQKEFLNLLYEDIESFKVMEKVFNMPKNTNEELLIRNKSKQDACKICCIPPIKILKLSYEGLKVVKNCVGKLNKTALSDIGVSVINLKASAYGAWTNLLVNLMWIDDKKFVEENMKYKDTILKESSILADEIYNIVENMLIEK